MDHDLQTIATELNRIRAIAARSPLAVLCLVAVTACGSPAAPAPSPPIAPYVLTITSGSSCPTSAILSGPFRFSMALFSSDGRAQVFVMVPDVNWFSADLPGLSDVTLRVTTNNGTTTGQISGGGRPSFDRQHTWMVFKGTVDGTNGLRGSLNGTITYNQGSPGSFSAECIAPDHQWSLVPL